MLPLIVLAAAALMLLVERRRPAREWPKVPGWWTRALLLNAVQFAVAYLAALSWDRLLAERRPWEYAGADGTGPWVGYVAITFVYYWWHRFRHANAWAWRWLHQVHHSPQRLEIVTSFYKHPLEILVNGVLSSALVYLLVGLSPSDAAQAILLTGLAELYYHWNVNTPRWLGFVLQRPESHCVHHQQGLHALNYADLPIWDMLFGTFHNPRRWNARCGFAQDRELQLGAMLRGDLIDDRRRYGSAGPPKEPTPATPNE